MMDQQRLNSLPRVGAAVTVERLEQSPELRRFLIEHNRDVEVQDFLSPSVIAGDWKTVAARARELLDGHAGRVGIHGPFVSFSLEVDDPEFRSIVRKRLLDGVMACAAVSGPDRQAHMVVHSPFTTWNWHNLNTRPGSRQALFERVHANMGEAVRRASEEGVVIVIENTEDKDPADRLALAHSFASEAVKVSLDTGHAHYAHVSTGAPAVDVYVTTAANDLAHVHLQDADGFADRHWRLGEGAIRWPAVFREIAALDVEPRLIIEVKDAGDILPSAQFLIDHGLAV